MKTVKILHTADVHIGAQESFLGTFADKRRYETLITFEKIFDLAKSENVDILLTAGDLFDSNSIEERFVDAAFSKIETANDLKVVYCAGNHDPLDETSPFTQRQLPDNLYVLATKDQCITFEELKVKVYGRSFERAFLKGEEKFTLEADSEYINILLQHGELKSDLNSEYNSITPKFVKDCKMDYIALGHVHKRSDIGKMGQTYFAYSGCPEGQGFDELDEKGVYIGEVGKGICDLKFVPVSKRRHISTHIDVSDCKNSAEISQKILNQLSENFGENFSENLYKIELTGEISEEIEIEKNEIESRLLETVYFVKIKNSTELEIDYETLSKEASLKGIFVKKMLEKIESTDDKEAYKNALILGLKAFKGEVKYDED